MHTQGYNEGKTSRIDEIGETLNSKILMNTKHDKFQDHTQTHCIEARDYKDKQILEKLQRKENKL